MPDIVLQKMDVLRGWFRANTMEMLVLVWLAMFSLAGYINTHTNEPMHPGVLAAIRVYTSESNIYNWYSELSDIERRRGRGELTSQDTADERLFSRLMLDTCRALREAGSNACDSLPGR